MDLRRREHHTFHTTACVYDRKIEAWLGPLLLAKQLNHLSWLLLRSLRAGCNTNLLHERDLTAANQILRLVLFMDLICSRLAKLVLTASLRFFRIDLDLDKMLTIVSHRALSSVALGHAGQCRCDLA